MSLIAGVSGRHNGLSPFTAGSEVPWTLSFLAQCSTLLETPCPEQAGGKEINVPGVFSQRLFIRFVRILFTVSSAMSPLFSPVRLLS